MKIFNRIKRFIYKTRLKWRVRKLEKPVRDFTVNICMNKWDDTQYLIKHMPKPAAGKELDKFGELLGYPREAEISDNQYRESLRDILTVGVKIR